MKKIIILIFCLLPSLSYSMSFETIKLQNPNSLTNNIMNWKVVNFNPVYRLLPMNETAIDYLNTLKDKAAYSCDAKYIIEPTPWDVKLNRVLIYEVANCSVE